MFGWFHKGEGDGRPSPRAIAVETIRGYDLYDTFSLEYLGEFKSYEEAKAFGNERGYRVENY